jgi:HSP20 family molecular chaperone IbpA
MTNHITFFKDLGMSYCFTTSPHWQAYVEVYYDDLGTATFRVECPGYAADELKVITERGFLEVRGSRVGSEFVRKYCVSKDFDLSRADVECEFGILRISVPLHMEHLKRELKVSGPVRDA